MAHCILVEVVHEHLERDVAGRDHLGVRGRLHDEEVPVVAVDASERVRAALSKHVLEELDLVLKGAVRVELTGGLEEILARVERSGNIREAVGRRDLEQALQAKQQRDRAARLDHDAVRVNEHAALAAGPRGLAMCVRGSARSGVPQQERVHTGAGDGADDFAAHIYQHGGPFLARDATEARAAVGVATVVLFMSIKDDFEELLGTFKKARKKDIRLVVQQNISGFDDPTCRRVSITWRCVSNSGAHSSFTAPVIRNKKSDTTDFLGGFETKKIKNN